MVSVKKLEHYIISKESRTIWLSVKNIEHYVIRKESSTLWYQ